MSKFKVPLIRPNVGAEEAEAVRKVIESGWLAEGSVTEEFERRLAEYVGGKYAVATTNCTVALELCLKAQNIKGEVIVPDFTYPGTANAVYNAGATPVLVDVNLDTYNIDLNHNPKADAVMPVSWGGNPLWTYPHGVKIIEDAACSLGSQFNGSKTGSGWTTCFSFHPRKLLACGHGGMVTTDDEQLANNVRALKNFGYTDNFTYKYGTNNKLGDVLSAIGIVQLGKLELTINKRIDMAKIYNDLLSEVSQVRVPWKHELARHTYQTYAVYLETGDRDTIIHRFAQEGIETQIGTYALHLLPAFKDTKRIGPLRNAALLYQHLLALPLYSGLSEETQKQIVTLLKGYVR